MVIDELGRELTIPPHPERIISLVPSLTEYLIWLGAAERLVARTEFCIAPAEIVASIPTIRGTKNPAITEIIALKPDVVLASKEENRQRDVEALAEAGIAVYVTDIVTVRGAIHSLQTIAALLGLTNAAAPLLDAITTELTILSPPTVWVAVPIWRDPWMLVGGDTYADDLLRCCGAINVAEGLEGRYPKVTLEQLAELNPDVLLLPDEPYHFTEADLPAVEFIAAQKLLCSGEFLTWYGPRIPEALRTFRAALTRIQRARE